MILLRPSWRITRESGAFNMSSAYWSETKDESINTRFFFRIAKDINWTSMMLKVEILGRKRSSIIPNEMS